jgi:hypothetical protein
MMPIDDATPNNHALLISLLRKHCSGQLNNSPDVREEHVKKRPKGGDGSMTHD